jgi:hypothetical protein
MSDFDLASVIGRVADRAGAQQPVMFVALVSQTSPLRIDTQGATFSAQRLTSYTPVVADSVLVARLGSRFVVLGKVSN